MVLGPRQRWTISGRTTPRRESRMCQRRQSANGTSERARSVSAPPARNCAVGNCTPGTSNKDAGGTEMKTKLINFRRFHETPTVEFPGGLTIISGPNGAGKSTLVEAVVYALFGPVRGHAG